MMLMIKVTTLKSGKIHGKQIYSPLSHSSFEIHFGCVKKGLGCLYFKESLRAPNLQAPHDRDRLSKLLPRGGGEEMVEYHKNNIQKAIELALNGENADITEREERRT